MNILHNSAIHGKTCSQIHIRITKEGNMAAFVFEDNGSGFPEEYLRGGENARWPSAFSPGGTDRKKNMGIGLSVCRTIIEAHKGIITLSNMPQGGALVRFDLPLTEN